MGRKSRLKRERRQHRAGGVEVLPGIWAKQEGRRILWENKQTKKQWHEWREKLKGSSDVLAAEISEQVVELQRRLRELPTLQLLAQLASVVILYDPEKYKEPETVHPLITVEYPTWLALLEPTPTRSNHVYVIKGPELDDVLMRIRKLLNQVTWYFISRGLPAKGEKPSAIQEVQFFTRLYEMGVRSPGYHHHLTGVLRELLTPFDKDLRDLVGFTIEEAVRLEKALGEMMSDAFDVYREEVKSAEAELLDKVKDFSGRGIVSEGVPESLLEDLSRLSLGERNTVVRNLTTGWGLFGLERVFTVFPKSVAAKAGVAEEVAMAFLSRFSLPFGQTPISNSWPSRYEPLEKAPLLRLPDGGYYAHLVPKLLWAIRPNLEDVLLHRKGIWARYNRHRSKFLETKALELLAKCLPGATAYHDLSYSIRNEHGEETQCQLDGMLMYDSVLFLLEAKAGSLSPEARRGAPSLREDLETILGEGHEQALRSLRYLESAEQVTFKQRAVGPIHVRKRDFARVILVTVSLDSLSTFTTGLAELSQLGIIKPGQFPWAVDLLDLYVFAELIEFGAQLVHYLQCRMELNTQPVRSFDELDYLGHYFKFGLNFGFELSNKPTQIGVLSHTVDFDDYFLYQMGQRRTPAPKPSQALPAGLRQYINGIAGTTVPSHVEKICDLLDGWRSSLSTK